MRRLSIAMLMALYVGLAPFAMGTRPLSLLTVSLALGGILYLVRRLASAPTTR